MAISRYVKVRGDVLRVDDKAVLFVPADSSNEVWIPKSQIHRDDLGKLYAGSADVTFRVTKWFTAKLSVPGV
jgi:hypothetical protein